MQILTYLFYLYLLILSLALLGLLALNLVKSERKPFKIKNGYRPRTLVIVPCKGADISLEKGLKSIKEQDYGAGKYDVIAVVDSDKDTALHAIKKAGIRYAISDSKASGSGKVRAISTALEKFSDYDAYVVADSDITSKSSWLRLLMEPLSDPEVGISTTFPYFEPVAGSGFWTRVKMVWGFVGNGLLEKESTRFAWGGSMAFRKGLLDRTSLNEFKQSLSDDIAITKIAKRKSLRIYYVKEKVVSVPSKETFSSFAEWSNRQTALTLLGYKENFRRGMIFYCANVLLLLSGIILSVFYNAIAVVFLIPFVIGLAKTYRRAERIDLTIIPLFFIIDFVYIANLIVARSMRDISWRGNTYALEQ